MAELIGHLETSQSAQPKNVSSFVSINVSKYNLTIEDHVIVTMLPISRVYITTFLFTDN